MKLYRFLKAAFHDNRMVQPGEEVLCSDDIIPGAHMVDVAAEAAAQAAGTPYPPPPEAPPGPVFRSGLAYDQGSSIFPDPRQIAYAGYPPLVYDDVSGGYNMAPVASVVPAPVDDAAPDIAPELVSPAPPAEPEPASAPPVDDTPLGG